MNYTNITALAAAVAASANTNASAGIGTSNHFNKTTNNNAFNIHHKRVNCINNSLDKNSDNSQIVHQIGTNLVNLTVCWHKMNDNCSKCNEPIYKGN